MAKTILGNSWVAVLKGGTDSVVNMLNFVNTLATFISTNVNLVGVFNGVLPSPPATPSGPLPSTNLVDSSLLMNQVIKCSPATEGDGSIEWLDWMQSLYSLIATTVVISTGQAIPIAPTFAFPTLVTPTWSRNDLKNIIDNGSDDVQGDCMDVIANGIVTDLVSNFIVTPVPSNYGSYVGTCTYTTVSILN